MPANQVVIKMRKDFRYKKTKPFNFANFDMTMAPHNLIEVGQD